jgi:hypothetical protein
MVESAAFPALQATSEEPPDDVIPLTERVCRVAPDTDHRARGYFLVVT